MLKRRHVSTELRPEDNVSWLRSLNLIGIKKFIHLIEQSFKKSNQIKSEQTTTENKVLIEKSLG